MSAFPNSTRLLKGGIVLLDPDTSAVVRIIAQQYNPDTLTRTLQVKAFFGGAQHPSEALRIKRAPGETITLDGEVEGVKGQLL